MPLSKVALDALRAHRARQAQEKLAAESHAQHGFIPELERFRVAWIGDGNNMANSWHNAAQVPGLELTLACPTGYEPDPELLARSQEAGGVRLVRDPGEAAERAHDGRLGFHGSVGEAADRMEAFPGVPGHAGAHGGGRP